MRPPAGRPRNWGREKRHSPLVATAAAVGRGFARDDVPSPPPPQPPSPPPPPPPPSERANLLSLPGRAALHSTGPPTHSRGPAAATPLPLPAAAACGRCVGGRRGNALSPRPGPGGGGGGDPFHRRLSALPPPAAIAPSMYERRCPPAARRRRVVAAPAAIFPALSVKFGCRSSQCKIRLSEPRVGRRALPPPGPARRGRGASGPPACV